MRAEFSKTPARQREAQLRRQFAGDRLNANDQPWGEKPGASGSWAVIETMEALLEETLTPHADDFASRGEVVCDLVIGETLVSQEDHLGADYLIIRQRILVRSSSQFLQSPLWTAGFETG